MKWRLLGTLLVAGALLAAACGTGSPSSAAAGGSSGKGGASASGAHTITVGAWGPETGAESSAFAINQGADAYFAYLNSKGGVNGYKFKYVVLNDQFNPSLTPGVARQLVEQDHVFAIVGGVGTPGNEAVKSYLLQAKVPNIAPGAGNPNLANEYSYTEVPNYTDEAALQLRYMVQTLKVKNVALLYENDSIGQPALPGVQYESSKLGVKVEEIPFDASLTNFVPLVSKLQSDGAQGVLLWSSVGPYPLILKAASSIGYTPKWISINENAATSILQNIPTTEANNAYFDDWLPSPSASVVTKNVVPWVTKEYPGASVGTLTLQGWVGAAIFANAVQKATASGKPLTLSSFIKAMNQTNLSNSYIHDLTYTSSDHVGLPGEALLRYDNGNFSELTPYGPDISVPSGS